MHFIGENGMLKQVMVAAVLLVSVPAAANTKYQKVISSVQGPVVCNILQVTDGDTFRASCIIWPGTNQKAEFRVRNIDSPELRNSKKNCASAMALAARARDTAKRILVGKTVELEQIETSDFSRFEADVKVDGKSFADLMVEQGMARYSPKGRQLEWCNLDPMRKS